VINRILTIWLLITGGACLKAAVSDGGATSERLARVGLCLFAITTAWPHVSESKIRKEQQP
jgi:hypothetical protein